MRKVVYGVGISLDGYIARPDGSVDFLFMPKDYSMAPFFKRCDTAVLGRKTYEAGLKMSGGKMSGYGMKCYIFSKTLGEVGHADFVVVKEALKPFVEAQRKKKGKDIWLMGGGELTRAFLQEDLVDELYLGVVPTLIGDGIPAFPGGFPQREFKLAENKTYSQGMIALRYQRAKKKNTKV
jgi:dihydrofolate reductase